jgi:hypothetical protein
MLVEWDDFVSNDRRVERRRTELTEEHFWLSEGNERRRWVASEEEGKNLCFWQEVDMGSEIAPEMEKAVAAIWAVRLPASFSRSIFVNGGGWKSREGEQRSDTRRSGPRCAIPLEQAYSMASTKEDVEQHHGQTW